MPSPSSSSSFLLSITTHKLTKETDRADAAESKCIQLAQQLRAVTDRATSLQLQLDKSQQELGLFRIQLDLANQEIDKAEETVMRIDRARLRAEEQAARERSKVRQLMEKIAIDDALHHGRELGFREGLERGKILGWAELISRRNGIDDRDSGRQSRQSITRPSSATSNSARRRSTPRPQQADIDVLPVRPPSQRQNTAAPIQHPQPVQASNPPENSHVHTTPRRSGTPSAARPVYRVPPDGYIPTVEAGSAISLPPPHELSRQFTTTPSTDQFMTDRVRPGGSRPSSTHSNRRNDMQGSETMIGRSRTPGRARSPSIVSGESRSTTISQYEFVRPPHAQNFSPRSEGMHQQWQEAVSDLHDITGYENSLNSTDDHSASTGQSSQVPKSPLNTADDNRRLTPSNSPAIYHRPLRDEFENERSNEPFRSSASSEVNIGVISASNSPSNTTHDTFAESGFLTPNLDHSTNHTRHTQTSNAETTSNLIVLPSNELPPGFVPSPVPTQLQLP